jgi:excinuclease ABC subunit A
VRRLADRGNAVVLVEHDLDVIRAADRVLDLGPGAGRHGGELVYSGTPAGLREAATATGRALRGEGLAGLGGTDGAAGPVRGSRVSDSAGEVRVVGARANNLKGITVGFPLGGLVAVCGVSGSGKSSLVVDVLAAGARRAFGGKEPAGADPPGEHDRIEGLSALDEVLLVDQSPLGRSARSNPATMTKAWDEVRALLARTPAARKAGLGPGRFSFNAPGGRCETCEGSGTVTVDMQFLADVEVVCDSCDGRRFRPEVLEVRLRGRNVDELLETTVEEALDLFYEVPALVRKLTPLADAGLSYLRLGQSTATLSGGEAQRLKIAARLTKGGKGRTLFLFDEPTTGLHPGDVSVLLVLLRRLVAAGHSVVAVEHDVPFLLAADHLVELGPGAGDRGGEVVFEGTPAEMARRGATPTAGALRRELASRAGG